MSRMTSQADRNRRLSATAAAVIVAAGAGFGIAKLTTIIVFSADLTFMFISKSPYSLDYP